MKRIAYLVALVAALALAATTGTFAATHPDNRPTHGIGAVALEQQSDVVRPDDRATHGTGAVVIQPADDAVRPDDRAIHGQGAILVGKLPAPGQAATTEPDEVVLVDGFDWADAAIGAAAAFGLGLIVAGGVGLAVRRAHAPAYS